MARLVVRLFGPPQIECDGAAVTVSRRKAIALLAYLVVSGQSHRRDSLVNLLWPNLDTSSGRTALRRTLYALNQALEGDWLDAGREEIGLAPDAAPAASSAQPATSSGQELWVDVVQFRQHLGDCETHGHPPADVCPDCASPLTEAVGLARGEFLAGFGLADSANFDDWQLLQTEALRRELAGALDRLVRWHSAEREFDTALAHARRRLALDSLDEGAHRALMRLYAWSGHRPAALRQYEECVEVLEDQLGVPPHEATTELYRTIEAGQAPPLPVSGRGRGHPAPTGEVAAAPAFLDVDVPVERPVFVAREHELARLDAHLQAALAGQGKVVFITGDAGNGKTALIQAFARRAQEAHPDLVVASGNCNAYTGIGDPYLPFREILGLLTGDVEAQWAAGAMTREHARRLWNTLPLAAQALVKAGPDLVGTFVPRVALLERAMASAPGRADWLTRLEELAERRPAGPGMQLQIDLFEQYTHVLQALTRQAPLVLVLDDLQWADAGSISLLFHLGRHLRGSRILIAGAYRAEEVAIGRGGERHPLDPVINEFQRSFGNIVINLARADSRDFVEALLDSEPNRLGTEFREMLHRQTRGHPLFTIELLRGLQERGDLDSDPEGHWIEGTSLDWETLPARVEAVIAERIGRLAEPLQAVLRVASVEGEQFTAEVVARVRATDEGDMLRHLSRELDKRHRLVRAQSIQRIDGQLLSSYRFRHILFQRYLYGSLDEVERVHLHERIGTALEELYGARGAVAAIAVQLALHFQKARSTEKAIHYLHRAGESAVQLSAHQEAIAHLNSGLGLLLGQPDPIGEDERRERAEQELALQLALGMAWLGASGVAPELEEALSRARELCLQMGRTSQLSQVVGGLSIYYCLQAEHQRARELAEEALCLAVQAGDPLLVALHHWYLGFILFCMGEFARALDHLEQVMAFYVPEEHHRPFLALRGTDAGLGAMAYAACCLWCLGYPEQALQQGAEALALARAVNHPFCLAEALFYGGCMLNLMGRDAPALKDNTEALIHLAEERGFSGWLRGAMCFQGEALAMLGQVEEGIARMREALTASQSAGSRQHQSRTLYAQAEALAMAGQPEKGLSTVAEALALVEETDERYWEAELHRLRAELLLMQGEAAEAETSFQRAIDVARRQQAKSWELRATTGLARLWHEQGRTAEAHAMLAEIFGWFTEGFDTPDLLETRALLEALAPD